MISHFISFIWVFISLTFFLKTHIFFLPISVYFFITGEGVTGREQPQVQKVTQAGPKSHASRSKKSRKGQNATLECYNTSQLSSSDGSQYKARHSIAKLYVYIYIMRYTGGGVSIKRCLTSIGIPMLHIRPSRDHLIFNMGIPKPEIRRPLYSDRALEVLDKTTSGPVMYM